MKAILAVFFGSGLGGVIRFMMNRMIRSNSVYAFPLNTFVVNFLACFIVGCILGFGDKLPENTRLLLAVGFCGGFSTFSAFSGETFLLLQQGQYLQATLYVTASVIFCVAATFAGYWIMTEYGMPR